MNVCVGERLSPGPAMSVKEESGEQIETENVQDFHKSHQQSSVYNDEDNEQQIECTTESHENDIRAFLSKCVFCNKNFISIDDLKLLECLHTICIRCISIKRNDQNTSVDTEVFVKSGAIVCFICNITSHVENLIENRFISKMVHEECNVGSDEERKDCEAERQCTSCNENAIATSYCIDCEEFICQNCVMAHQRLKITKDHTIQPRSSAGNDDSTKSGEKKIQGHLFCIIHPHEQLSLFCQTCDRLTCRDCQLTDHRDHKYNFIHEIAATTRTSVSTLLKEVSYKRVLLKSAMKVIEDRQILILEKKKNLVQDITNMVVQLTNTINVRSKQLVLRLNEVCDQKQSTLNEKKIALEQLSRLTDHCIQFVSYALEKGSDVELLYSKKSIANHLQRIKSRRADIPNPEIPVRINLSLEKLSDLNKVLSTIGAIVVDGRVYPSTTPMPEKNPTPVSFVEQPPTKQQIMIPPIHVETSSQPMTSSSLSNNMQQNCYQRIIQHRHSHQQQPQSQLQHVAHLPSHMQHYPPPHMPPRSSPQNRMPYNVNFSSSIQQSLLLSQNSGLTGHQQQVTSSTHPHQQVHVDQMVQNASLRGLLGHSSPYRPPSNHVSYRMPPASRYPITGPQQRSTMSHAYSPSNAAMARLSPYNTNNTQHMSFPPQQQQATARWHIPQNLNPCLPHTAVRQHSMPPMYVPSNDSYKITLKSAHNNDNKLQDSNQNSDNMIHLENSPSSGQTISSSMPKTPSPTLHSKSDEMEKSLDKFCQKSLNDLMLTIAKLDSNGIVVIPEDQKNHMDSSHVDSSTDEAVHSLGSGNVQSTAKTTPNSVSKDDPNEDWCAVCMDGGDAVLCCDKCPKVFHLYCHIPAMKTFPEESETWQCMLCSNVLDCSENSDDRKQPNRMTPRESRIAQRIVLELYCQYEQSLPFREVVSPEIVEYHRVIKKPMALDVIKNKLKLDNSGHYTDLRQVMADIRLMFKNAFTYNPVESQIYQEARNLEEFFEKLLLKWAPNYAYDDPFLTAEVDEEEEISPPNRKYRRIIND